jgi:hypothetical protein
MNHVNRNPLPGDFVTARVMLTPAELATGYEMGLLDDRGAVKVAESLLAGGAIPSWVEDLAILLSSEYDRVPELLSERASSESPIEDPSRVWLFLVLAHLHAHRDEVADPLGEIESIYADFEYPAEIDGLVRYLPAPADGEAGPAAVEARWQAYIDQRTSHYAGREPLT